MWNSGLDEAQAGIKIARRNINNLRYADDITFMEESEEELKNLLMKVKEETEKAREFQKSPTSALDYAKAFDCVDHNKLWKTL